MGKIGKFDASGLGKFRAAMKKALNEARQKEFIEDCAGKLADELLKRVVQRTPQGDYSGNSYICSSSDTGRSHKGSKDDKQGGALRDAWHCGIKEWQGGKFVIEIINDAKNERGEAYASYVEYGHRTPRGMKSALDKVDKSQSELFVPGHFMMEISRKEVEELAPKTLEALLKRKLTEVFGI